jgi:hypothetical protein
MKIFLAKKFCQEPFSFASAANYWLFWPIFANNDSKNLPFSNNPAVQAQISTNNAFHKVHHILRLAATFKTDFSKIKAIVTAIMTCLMSAMVLF